MSEMTVKGGDIEALVSIFEQMPEPMQRALAGLAKTIVDEQRDHAACVMGLEAEATIRIQQIDSLRSQTAALDVAVAALRDDNAAICGDIAILHL